MGFRMHVPCVTLTDRATIKGGGLGPALAVSDLRASARVLPPRLAAFFL